jgi:hypothetical protein
MRPGVASAPLKSAKPLDGRDVSPLLLETANPWPDRTIFSHQNGRVSARTQQYRLDDRGALFDLVADPGQKTDIARHQPEVAARLAQAVSAWRKEVLPDGKDDRPYPVGFTEFPATPLPARDGVPHGGVKRSANAPNCSYFVNWKSPEDSMTWDIEVHTPGNYAVEILYTCPAADVGSAIELAFMNSKLHGKVASAWDPPLLDAQDRVPRRGESYLKDFKPLKLGRMRLEKGRGLLTLRALQIPGQSVMDVRMITLTLEK